MNAMNDLGSLADLPTEYVEALASHNLVPLWPSLRGVLPPTKPRPNTRATHWAYKDIKPLLLQAIKNATGMSSSQMNSNAELKFYLNAATDPQKGYQENMNAISRLQKMYGLGSLSERIKPKTEGSPSTSSSNKFKVIGVERPAQ
jgi:hypothetical protein